ncbi:hypothetical protein TorRG33x02_349600, partial [Trema orientale]
MSAVKYSELRTICPLQALISYLTRALALPCNNLLDFIHPPLITRPIAIPPPLKSMIL